MSEKRTPINAYVYGLVTNHFIAQLKQGIIPWYASFIESGIPKNLVTGLPYHGLNVWLLSELGYSQNLFLTYNQARAIGGKIKNGEKGHLAVYWATANEKMQLRYYKLYNLAQCENIPAEKIPPFEQVKEPVKLCKEIIDGMPKPPNIMNNGLTVYYNPTTDCVHFPPADLIESDELYYSAMFYAFVHSTGHVDRLNRIECFARRPVMSRTYCSEELVAEMGSSYLCSFAGIKCLYPLLNQDDVDGWIAKLQSDDRIIVSASVQAQKAVNYILKLPEYTGIEKPTVMTDVE
jgi:antirestriction protein ArdC